MPRALRLTVVIVTASTLCAPLAAQGLYRSIDGYGNNLEHANWGAAGDTIVNRCRPNFADGRGAPAGAELPNTRTLSNVLFHQPGDMPSPEGLNDLFWAFGQFVDHDIVLTHNSETEALPIRIPTGDVMFDPQGTGRASIPMMRSAAMHGDSAGLRRYANELTAFLDASAVYGETPQRAAWLRSFRGGRLKVSAGDLPPFNTLTGEFGGPVDASAPAMDGMRYPSQRVMVCGDVRANENSLLAAMHTAWLREHNWLCDSLAERDPGLRDEDLYQAARRLLIAEFQQVVYREWLPELGVDIGPEVGYDPTVNPGISNEFAAAGFRFGHSLVGSRLVLVDEGGNPTSNSPIALRDVFFDPVAVVQNNGVAALIRGAATHRQQTFDGKVVEDLRSFLFGQPGQGGMDLVAINIMRGRDRGVARFGDMREDLGLPPITSFEALTGESVTSARLGEFYGSVNDIDPWVGLLVEQRDGMTGSTLRAMLVEQFERLRAGDRYFAAHEGNLTGEERAWVEQQTLAKILARSSRIYIDDDSFRAAPVVGLASAKTRRAEPIRARVTDGALVVEGSARGVRRITLRDATGRLVSAWDESQAAIAPNDAEWVARLPLAGAPLGSGLYACSVESGSGVSSAFVHVLR